MSSSSLSSVSPTAPGADEIVSDKPAPANDLGKVPLWRSAVILIVAAMIGLAYFFNPPLDIEPQAGVVMDLPVIMGDYLGKLGEISQVEHDILPKDTEFARRYYEDSKGHQINCSIVLSGAEQRSIHRPEACLQGQGWTIVRGEYVPIQLLSGNKLTGEKLTLERRITDPKTGSVIPVRAFYIYWFVGQNVTTPSEIHRVLLSNWDRVMHNVAHRWAYVSVFSLITDNLRQDGENAEQTEARMVDFSKRIVPTFQISEMPGQAKN
jgi:hypothetical protein